jgi:hypothetical protein
MRTVKATVYIMGERRPDTTGPLGETINIRAGRFTGERISTIEAGSIKIQIGDKADGDHTTLDDIERIVIAEHAADAMTMAEGITGHRWNVEPTNKYRGQLIELTGEKWNHDVERAISENKMMRIYTRPPSTYQMATR